MSTTAYTLPQSLRPGEETKIEPALCSAHMQLPTTASNIHGCAKRLWRSHRRRSSTVQQLGGSPLAHRSHVVSTLHTQQNLPSFACAQLDGIPPSHHAVSQDHERAQLDDRMTDVHLCNQTVGQAESMTASLTPHVQNKHKRKAAWELACALAHAHLHPQPPSISLLHLHQAVDNDPPFMKSLKARCDQVEIRDPLVCQVHVCNMAEIVNPTQAAELLGSPFFFPAAMVS